MKIEIVQGEHADALLASESFREQWTSLHMNCPFATPFQAPAYASTWYTCYRNRYLPVLVMSRGGDGSLQGLFPLAYAPDRREIGTAGLWQTEYHTWISDAAIGDEFALNAVRELQLAFPSAVMKFTYLPSDVPIRWMDAIAGKCLLTTHRRPLNRFGDGKEIYDSLKKRGNKGKLRRLARYGKIEFKRVTEPGEIESMFQDVITWSDARRVAVTGSPEFRNDPLKAPFHLAMMKVPGLLHVTALKAGERTVSVHLNFASRRHVQLGMISHDPMVADCSPGKFHILMLERMLFEDGYEYLDLTPGGDPYKERFANAWDEVNALTVFPNSLQRRVAALCSRVESGAKRALWKIGIRPARAKLVARRIMECPMRGAASRVAGAARDWIFGRHETRLYARELSPARDGSSSEDVAEESGRGAAGVRRDCLDDLLKYQPARGSQSLQEFLAAAFQRIESDQHVYTIVENGQLMHVGWLLDSPTKTRLRKRCPTCRSMARWAGTALVLELHTFPEAQRQGLASLSLRAMIRDAARVAGATRIIAAVPANDVASRRIVECRSFVHEYSIYNRRTLGWSSQRVEPPAIRSRPQIEPLVARAPEAHHV